jgi:hypothetical protein
MTATARTHGHHEVGHSHDREWVGGVRVQFDRDGQGWSWRPTRSGKRFGPFATRDQAVGDAVWLTRALGYHGGGDGGRQYGHGQTAGGREVAQAPPGAAGAAQGPATTPGPATTADTPGPATLGTGPATGQNQPYQPTTAHEPPTPGAQP